MSLVRTLALDGTNGVCIMQRGFTVLQYKASVLVPNGSFPDKNVRQLSTTETFTHDVMFMCDTIIITYTDKLDTSWSKWASMYDSHIEAKYVKPFQGKCNLTENKK